LWERARERGMPDRQRHFAKSLRRGMTDAELEVILRVVEQSPPLPNPSPARGEGL